jgi:hypothetical protein
VDTKISQQRSEMMITKMITSAFGYGNFDGIDLVYPKLTPSKPEITSKIARFLAIYYSGLENIANDVLTLETMFEK